MDIETLNALRRYIHAVARKPVFTVEFDAEWKDVLDANEPAETKEPAKKSKSLSKAKTK